jgi:hypothetical protein
VKTIADHRNGCATAGTSLAALPRRTRIVRLLRIFIAALWLLIMFAGSNMWTKHALAKQITALTPHADTTSVLDDLLKSTPLRNKDWAEPRVDLNGNDVDDAVGDYRVDRSGEMYERHAPDTAMTHLGPAGT